MDTRRGHPMSQGGKPIPPQPHQQPPFLPRPLSQQNGSQRQVAPSYDMYGYTTYNAYEGPAMQQNYSNYSSPTAPPTYDSRAQQTNHYGYSSSPTVPSPHYEVPMRIPSNNHFDGLEPDAALDFADHSSMIVDVWANQLERAFEMIRKIVVDYPYVAMDTEFPGVVARPVGNFRSGSEFYYQTLRCNVNLLKIIQLGITFSNAQGHHPPGPCTWQFNFRFNLTDDIYAQDSIDMLTSSGIDFDKFAKDGIDVATFAELLISSGLVLGGHETPVRWLSFHSGYDFGYLIKVLTSNELPSEEEEFFDLMSCYFPVVFDVKYLLKQTPISDSCGLNKLGEDLSVTRIGPAHQAGSDSLLTCHCFFKLAQDYFPDNSIMKYGGILYGLGKDKQTDFNGQNAWMNPAITPSTPPGGSNAPATSSFPSSPSAPGGQPMGKHLHSCR
eukprot:Sspe_Gene.24806::Locus_9871_Transcript_1_1_Confidence_1.000_Length_1614::g.24806::m.24806/K12581/CNOT7_8, CAF1, POP2; CCR4-NOT transcription complex subunit 7/8